MQFTLDSYYNPHLSLDGRRLDAVITVTRTNRSPYFNMVVIDTEGYARVAVTPERPIFRRQDAPEVLDMTTVAYAVRRDFILRASGLFSGKVKAVIVPQERALDIDSELDFQYAEFLLARGLVKR